MLLCAACQTPTRQARRMVARAEALAETMPDSTARLIDSIFRMEANLNERQRMDLALLQGEALFRDAPLDDDDFEDTAYRVATSPELERAADYYAQKKRYDRAAHAALYSGYVQQHYNEKENAMRSFKAAEQYGLLANDSLTVARAEYRMGKNLLYDGMEQEALAILEKSENRFVNISSEKALALNLIAICHMISGNCEDTEIFLNKSLICADKSHSHKVKRKVLNNYAVFYRQQSEYGKAMECLNQIAKEPRLDVVDSLFLYLNIAKLFMAEKNMDSAAVYFNRLVILLPEAIVKNETKVTIYGAISRFEEAQGNAPLALKYRVDYEKLLSGIFSQRQEQAVYRIQRQYDYETMQSTMSQKLIRKHRIIIATSAVAIMGLIAFAVSRIRLAKIRKQEIEAKANLIHFMQQNKELLKRQKMNEKLHTDQLQKQSEKEIVYQELVSENHRYKEAYQEYAQKYSDAKNKELETIIRLAVYLKNNGEKAFLDTLKRTVFNTKTSSWEAIIMVFDTLYPNVRENLEKQHPELTEMEQKDFILSFFKVSRSDEADLLKTTIHTVDKLRNSVRKKLSGPPV